MREQAAQFNTLIYPQDEEVKAASRRLETELGEVANPAEYQEKLRALGEIKPPGKPVNIFRLTDVLKPDSRRETVLAVNENFNNKLDFKSDSSVIETPIVRFGNGFLTGPAWTKGSFKVAVDSDDMISWAKFVPEALRQEKWKSPEAAKPDGAPTVYDRLTLDYELQKSAMDFTEEQGLQSHQRLFSDKETVLKFPPRIAISIIEMPSGKILALGTYPRMSSDSKNWTLKSVLLENQPVDSWIPPVNWVERTSFGKIRNLYGQDHNFDSKSGESLLRRFFQTRNFLDYGKPKNPKAPTPGNPALEKNPPADTVLEANNNRRSNVDSAGAFASFITGKNVLPHILDNNIQIAAGDIQKTPAAENIESAFNFSVNPDLERELASKINPGKLNYLAGDNIRIYAADMQLTADKSFPRAARIMLAIVKKDDSGAAAENGIVISLQAESENKQTIVKMLKTFLLRYERQIKQLLDKSGDKEAD